MDLSNLSLQELRALQENIKHELKKREQQEINEAREKILAIAQSVGVSVKDLVGGGIKAKTGTVTVAVKFRHPSDASLRWTGRGRQPKWVKEWVESGKSLDEVRV